MAGRSNRDSEPCLTTAWNQSTGCQPRPKTPRPQPTMFPGANPNGRNDSRRSELTKERRRMASCPSRLGQGRGGERRVREGSVLDRNRAHSLHWSPKIRATSSKQGGTQLSSISFPNRQNSSIHLTSNPIRPRACLRCPWTDLSGAFLVAGQGKVDLAVDSVQCLAQWVTVGLVAILDFGEDGGKTTAQ